MDDQRRGNWLLAAQAGCALAYLLPGPRLWPPRRSVTATALTLLATGGLIGASGAATLGQHLRAHPVPAAGARLRTDGAYRYVRHPVYVGLLTAATGLTMLRGRPPALAAWLVLHLVLSQKARLEEKLLTERFGDQYRQYAASVPLGWPATRAPERRR